MVRKSQAAEMHNQGQATFPLNRKDLRSNSRTSVFGSCPDILEDRDIEIRYAAPADALALALILYESFREYESLYTPEAFAATVLTSDKIRSRITEEGGVWVAQYKDVPVGTVSALPMNDQLYIRSMAVAPSARGCGVGRLLLQQMERSATDEGLTRLTLKTTPFLTRAIRLYEHFGFQCIDDEPDDLFGTPLIVMEKILRS
jgi:putative acetyltransferase